MEMKELKEVLASFDNHSGAKIKYFLAKSIFPEQTDQELKEITGINARHFASIRSEFIVTPVPLLKFDNSSSSEELELLRSKVVELQAELDKFRDEWEKDFFKRADTETTLRNEVAKLTKERDDWKATAKICKQEAEDYKRKLSAGRERNPLLEGLD